MQICADEQLEFAWQLAIIVVASQVVGVIHPAPLVTHKYEKA